MFLFCATMIAASLSKGLLELIVRSGDDGLRSLTTLLRTADGPAGACLASDKDVRKHAPGTARGVPMPHTPFFLDEGQGLEMRAVHACLAALTRGNPIDDVLPPNKAAYLSDVMLIDALRSHPARVFDPQAAVLHITGVTPSASLIGNYSCARVTGETHETRMRRATDALRGRIAAAQQAGLRRVYLVQHPSWNLKAIGAELRALMREDAHREHFIVATGDRVYANRISAFHAERAIIVPYVASARIDAEARCALAHARAKPFGCEAAVEILSACTTAPPPPFSSRELSVYFVGNAHRQRGEGKVRWRVLDAIARHVTRGRFVDRVFRQQNKHRLSYADMAVECAREMQSSRFCLAPAGDVPTSRRIPDAMAAGCLPVHVGKFELMRFNLPFPNHVDWRAAALFAGSVDCLERTGAASAIGAALEALDPRILANASRHVRAQYACHLSFGPGGGAPSTLLREIYIAHGRALGSQRPPNHTLSSFK
jgi:hypothetical protein